MTDKYEKTTIRKQLAEEYSNKKRIFEEKLKAKLNSEQYNFFIDQGKAQYTSIYSDLVDAMREPGTPLSEYTAKKLGWLFGTAIQKREKSAVLYFADRLSDYPYSVSIFKRSFRAKNKVLYADKFLNMINEYRHVINTVEDPLEKILNRELPEDIQAYLDEYPWLGCGYNGWQVAYALDHNDTKIEDAVRRILTEANNSSMMTYELVQGVVRSHRKDFHELLGKLLSAARLQEGLRQVICESADCGTKDAFLSILDAIDNNDLIRFSSVKRAVGTWTGMISEDARDLDRISEKSVRLISDCLTSVSAREKYLASEDAMEIHTALWSYGFDDINQAIDKIYQIAERGSHHQLLTAGYFALNIDIPHLLHKVAKKVISLHRNEEDVLAVWLPCFLPTRHFYLSRMRSSNKPVKWPLWFDSKSEINEHYQAIKSLYDSFSGKVKSFSPCIFPWFEANIAKSDLAELLCLLAIFSGNTEKMDEVCPLLKECDSDHRDLYFSSLLGDPKTPIQRKVLLEGLVGKDTYTRKTAYTIISKLDLSDDEYRSIEEYLRYKSYDIRRYVIELLLKQNASALSSCITRLLENKKEDVRLGGLDMLLRIKNDPAQLSVFNSCMAQLSKLATSEILTPKEKALIEPMLPKRSDSNADESDLFTTDDKYIPSFDEKYTHLCAETFSEYFPASELPEMIRGKKRSFNIFKNIHSTIKATLPCRSSITAAIDIISLSKFIEVNKTESFIDTDGNTSLIGNIKYPMDFYDTNGAPVRQDLWENWAQSIGLTNKRLLCATVLHCAYSRKTAFSEACANTVKTIFGPGFEQGKELPHSQLIGFILNHMCARLPQEDKIRLASAVAIWFAVCVPDDMVMVDAPSESILPIYNNGKAHLLSHRQIILLYKWLVCKNDQSLKYVFPLAVASAERCAKAYKNVVSKIKSQNRNTHYCYKLVIPTDELQFTALDLIDARSYLYAAYQGLITSPQLYKFLLDPDCIQMSLNTLSSVASVYYEGTSHLQEHTSYSKIIRRNIKDFLGKDGEPNEEDMNLIGFVAQVYEKIIPVVIESELSRGDSPANYSRGIGGIMRIYGAKYFAKILYALGSDHLDRNVYSGPSGYSRSSSLSYLLSVCVPAADDSEETFSAALSRKNLTDKRLIEAALYSQEWIPLIGKYLKINAFESVCYYFIAHMNEKFSDKRKAIIARFTPLSEDELNLGAFDVDWFRSAYEAIGDKEFDLIYDAAKYISDGAKHSRARKYADAALGKLDVAETEKTISEKRNKDLLMAYALIPIADEKDLCRRYLYIQQFKKESRKFGSQRIESEQKATEIALKNLAINAGYSDSMRLKLYMEAKLIEDKGSMFRELEVGGVKFRIATDESGKAELVCEKDGKQLKNIPDRLRKDDTVKSLSDTVKMLNEQYRRTRVMFENAMEDETIFNFGELAALSSHPVIFPILKKLVMISGDKVGFFAESGLSDDTDRIWPLDVASEIKIAHPFHLYKIGCWKNYQRYVFDNKVVQPFRQVFRELYIKTSDEADSYDSLRYSGNQILPAKTAGVLKGRRWIADIENGLQKIYYKENIVAQIYALADWFSPSDIEAPTLEWVCFSDRKTGEKIKISDVPDVLFSEVMRDVDLAVSVAHAGGVDPESSHSTIEMRTAILSFLLPLFHADNVSVENNHAVIKGKLADYSVNLGSGVVHQIGGTMIPVLPVHSQHRGKIFLPFTDDDPKTAEIISKVLLFAEDDKIRDPMILSNISK